MSKPRVSRSDEVVERILEGLEDGQTLTAICTGDDMPTTWSVMNWCRDDSRLDDRVLRARVRGLLQRLDRVADAQDQLVENPDKYDAKAIHAVATVLRDQNHTAIAVLTRLDKRFADKQEVVHAGPIVVGWIEGGTVIPSQPETTLPEPTAEPHGGGERRH